MSRPRPWSDAEDNLLKLAVAEYGDGPGVWKPIAQRIPNRSNKACRKRWLHSLSPTVRKTPWTPDEDALLLSLSLTHNPPRWSLIAKHIPGRTDDACSKRFREALDPQIKKDNWTDQEDATLLELTAQLGSKWTQVGQAMGRSGLGCRNRWRLLERKRHRFSDTPDNPPVSPHLADSHTTPIYTHSLPFQSGEPSTTLPRSPAFAHLHAYEAPAPMDYHPATTDVSSNSLIRGPPPNTISTASSLSRALAPTTRETSRTPSPPCTDPELASTPHVAPPDTDAGPEDAPSEEYEPTPPVPTSPVCAHASPVPNSPHAIPDDHSADPPQLPANPPEAPRAVPSTNTKTQEESPPRKRPRRRGPASNEQDAPEYPRLSSHLPANEDRTVFPYACGHPLCWPGTSGNGASCFATASELADHRRLGHTEPDSTGKAYRCALQGCGKGWKNINGIQYHLQISKAHFKAALRQTLASPDPGTASAPDTTRPKTSTPDGGASPQRGRRKEHRCPHDGCTNTYKQRTGLQYHLAHGHPQNVAQLDVIPPGLMRKITARSQLSGA